MHVVFDDVIFVMAKKPYDYQNSKNNVNKKCHSHVTNVPKGIGLA